MGQLKMRVARQSTDSATKLAAKRGQRGMTLIELMMAGAILTIGLLSLTGLASVAIMSNSRNRMDGLSNMLAQQVLEIVHYTMNASGVVAGSNTVTDCNGNTFTINSDAGGANISNGQVDYSQATVPSGYRMANYTVCPNPTTTSQITFDVRWNVQMIPNTVGVYRVTVGAKPVRWNNNARMYALPANISAIIGAGEQ
jgi:prepilin-type N-terminal cleavage/methylation domain-containing protein